MDSFIRELDRALQPLDNINDWIQASSQMTSNVNEAVDLIDYRVLTPKIIFIVFLLCLSTGVGAWGGFNSPPKVFTKLTKYGWFKFILVFTLIWQGGGGLNMFVTLMGTIAFYLLDYLLNRYETQILEVLGLDDDDE
jgi:hypothetical protein